MSPSRLLRVWCGVLGAKTRKLDLIGVLGTVKDPAVTKMPAATRADSDLAAASRPSPKPSPGKSFSRVFVRQTRHAHWLNRTEIQSSAADNQPAANHVAPARSQGCRSITGVSGADGSHPTPRASAKHGALGRRRELMGHCLSHSVRRKNYTGRTSRRRGRSACLRRPPFKPRSAALGDGGALPFTQAGRQSCLL